MLFISVWHNSLAPKHGGPCWSGNQEEAKAHPSWCQCLWHRSAVNLLVKKAGLAGWWGLSLSMCSRLFATMASLHLGSGFSPASLRFLYSLSLLILLGKRVISKEMKLILCFQKMCRQKLDASGFRVYQVCSIDPQTLKRMSERVAFSLSLVVSGHISVSADVAFKRNVPQESNTQGK